MAKKCYCAPIVSHEAAQPQTTLVKCHACCRRGLHNRCRGFSLEEINSPPGNATRRRHNSARNDEQSNGIQYRYTVGIHYNRQSKNPSGVERYNGWVVPQLRSPVRQPEIWWPKRATPIFSRPCTAVPHEPLRSKAGKPNLFGPSGHLIPPPTRWPPKLARVFIAQLITITLPKEELLYAPNTYLSTAY